MSCAERRACWLAGPCASAASCFDPGAAIPRSRSSLLPACRHVQGRLIHLGAAEARAADAVFYLRLLIQLPCLLSGQRGLVAEFIASRLPAPPHLCCLFFVRTAPRGVLPGGLAHRAYARPGVRAHLLTCPAARSRPSAAAEPVAA